MRPALIVLALLAALIGFAVLGLVIGAFLDPAGSMFAVIGSVVWTTYGPFLLLAAIASCLVGIVAMANRMRRLGGLALAVSAAGAIGACYILVRIGLAANAAGGSIDLPATLMLEEMSEPAPDMVETVRTVAETDLRAAVYLPAPKPVPAPVIVYVHGGGFKTGTFTETAADLRWFADRGWLVVSVEYRLFAPGEPTWDKAPDDVACALVWTYQNAERFGGDRKRIALLGDSAGGNLAINTGFAVAAGEAASSCGNDIPVPAAIAVQYPAVDPVSIYEDGYPVPGFEPKMLIEGYVGGPPGQYPERLAAVSSRSYINEKAPPTLIILPEKDSLVVPQGTLSFVREARSAGLDVELVRIPFANHVFNQIAANSPGNQIGRTVRLRFLQQNVR
ncbi:alpha/beta hydrolase [Zhengella sp. ZM62]|uniref:alpha/beta hydrolase n=1 Tax=Zhengella sedimenti TaxID=3390035 RepID=UPI0039753C8F